MSSKPSAVAEAIMSKREILLVMVGLMAGMFLSALDQTVVSTSMRTIADDLDGMSLQAWVTTAYMIMSTISTPLYGKLSDIFGRRPLFIIAISVFVIGSLLAGTAHTMYELAGYRAIQGLGAGGLMALPLAIMGDMLAPRERAKYQGFFLAVFGVSSVIGPLIGGVLSGTPEILGITGWRWVFLINVPIGIVALAIVLKSLHLPKTHRRVRIDWWGAATVITATVPLLVVAEQGREWGWLSPASISCYLIGVLSAVAFVMIERSMGDDALIPMKMFKSQTFSSLSPTGQGCHSHRERPAHAAHDLGAHDCQHRQWSSHGKDRKLQVVPPVRNRVHDPGLLPVHPLELGQPVVVCHGRNVLYGRWSWSAHADSHRGEPELGRAS
ncbi:MAG: hypothetical protein RLZZ52_983 [Actinomycetota bacterium]